MAQRPLSTDEHTRVVSVRIVESQAEQLVDLAAQRGVRASELVREAVSRELEMSNTGPPDEE